MNLKKPFTKIELTDSRKKELLAELSSLKSLLNKTNKQWQRMATIQKRLTINNVPVGEKDDKDRDLNVGGPENHTRSMSVKSPAAQPDAL